MLVIDGGGLLRVAPLGDHMAEALLTNGGLGIIINGAFGHVGISAGLPLAEPVGVLTPDVNQTVTSL